MKHLSILGSTGSIGTQTLDIVRENKEELKVVALAAGKNIELLEKQIREFRPEIVCVWDNESAKKLKLKTSDLKLKVVTGIDGLIETAIIKSADMVVTAMVGMIGIRPTIEAINEGKDIALANKETLVTAGHIIMPLARKKGVKILPVDSEHSAIFQCLNGEKNNKINKILLTASGGPFRKKTMKELENVTLKDALNHPNWSMGKKITIDSSTMVNKGLEVIEARWLFDVSFDDIQVVVQPQSLIHSMVEFEDCSIMAQLGSPDMKLPIQYAIFYPYRKQLNSKKVDFFSIKSIEFEEPDYEKFKGLRLAFEAGKKGGSLPCVYNAANEKAVELFIQGKVKYLDIANIIENEMNKHKLIENPDVSTILSVEKEVYENIERR